MERGKGRGSGRKGGGKHGVREGGREEERERERGKGRSITFLCNVLQMKHMLVPSGSLLFSPRTNSK